MNLKINHHHIYIFCFTSFFFFWGVNLTDFSDPDFLYIIIPNKIKLSYLIIFLLIPIFYNLIKKRRFHPKEVFNNQNYIIFFTLFIFAHYFFIKFYYNELFAKSEIANLIYLLLLSIIYCHFRNFIVINFKKILTFYLVIFITYSVYEGSQLFNYGFYDLEGALQFKNVGQCHMDLYLIYIIREYTGISLGNSIYLENSHLAMMSVAVFFSGAFILFQEKKTNILFLLLLLIEIIIVLNNLSTTYFVCYFISQIVLLFFFFKKINIKFWIVSLLLLSINSYLFFSDKNCTRKVTDFKVKDILEESLEERSTNKTTLIYKRSAILTLETLKNHSLGWGIDGMDDATVNLMDNYDVGCIDFKKWEDQINSKCYNNDNFNHQDHLHFYENEENRASWQLLFLNTKDGLSNLFKMFTEFGIFTFIIFFFFIKYILNIQNINSYNLFVIILFVTMCIRGVGYFNGGFIFCILEFFYYKKFVNEVEFKN